MHKNRALSEVIEDMTSDNVMNRLVQGDVGSGENYSSSISTCVICFKWISRRFNGLLQRY